MFSNRIVVAILQTFKTIGLPLFAISLLVLLLKSLLAASDGDKVSFTDILKRAAIGIALYEYGITIMQNLYLVLLDTCSKVVAVITGIDEVQIDIWNIVLDQVHALVGIVLLLVMIYNMFKVFLNLAERFWQLLVVLCMMYIYLPGFVSGNDEALILWGKQCLAIQLTQIFQVILVVTGMQIFVSTGDFGGFFMAIGAVIAASKVEQILDRYGAGAGGKLGNMARNGMSAAFYAKSIFKK